jgi:chromate transporter
LGKKVGFFELYCTFLKIGLLTFGGGFSMLPIIEKEAIDGKNWFSHEEMVNSFAVAQSIPGIIAVNTSALLGYKINKVTGAIATCLGVISPSIVIILLISKGYESFADNLYISKSLNGIRVAVLALLITTLISLIKKSIKDYWGAILALGAFITISFLNVSPIYVIILGIIASGLIYYKRGMNDGSPS